MSFLRLISLCIGVLVTCAPLAQAQDSFPNRSIRWIVPYAAGGGTDAVARIVASQMSQQMGQQVIVDNRPGGATIIAATTLASSPPDGHTVLTTDNGTLVFNTALFSKLPYDPKKDLSPVGLMVRFPLVLVVRSDSSINNVRELIDEIRKQPGKLNYATSGVGTPHHLAMEMLKDRAKLDIVHVAYKGAAPGIQAVLSGEMPMMVVDTAAGMAMIKAGRIRVLATFSGVRLPSLQQVPTLKELGYVDVEAAAWQGLVVPAATPKGVIARLSDEMQKAINTPSVRTRLTDLGLELTPSDPAAMVELWNRDDNLWPKLIRDSNIKLD